MPKEPDRTPATPTAETRAGAPTPSTPSRAPGEGDATAPPTSIPPDADPNALYDEILKGFEGRRPPRPKRTRETAGHFEAAYDGSGPPPARIDTPAPEPAVQLNISTEPGVGPPPKIVVTPVAPRGKPSAEAWRTADTVPTGPRPELSRGVQLTVGIVTLLLVTLAAIGVFGRGSVDEPSEVPSPPSATAAPSPPVPSTPPIVSPAPPVAAEPRAVAPRALAAPALDASAATAPPKHPRPHTGPEPRPAPPVDHLRLKEEP